MYVAAAVLRLVKILTTIYTARHAVASPLNRWRRGGKLRSHGSAQRAEKPSEQRLTGISTSMLCIRARLTPQVKSNISISTLGRAQGARGGLERRCSRITTSGIAEKLTNMFVRRHQRRLPQTIKLGSRMSATSPIIASRRRCTRITTSGIAETSASSRRTQSCFWPPGDRGRRGVFNRSVIVQSVAELEGDIRILIEADQRCEAGALTPAQLEKIKFVRGLLLVYYSGGLACAC